MISQIKRKQLKDPETLKKITDAVHPEVKRAFDFMVQAHEGQFDKTGAPYWMHPLSVMLNLENPTIEEQQSALGHDILEDTEYTTRDLLNEGFRPEAIKIIVLLTKKENDKRPYLEKIQDIIDSGNLSAVRVKIADNKENMHEERMSDLPEKTQQRLLGKYRPSIKLLQEHLTSELIKKQGSRHDIGVEIV